jgi:acetolactate synthase small subunit
MSKLSTLNYLINSYNAGANEVEMQFLDLADSSKNTEQFEFEPSQKSIDAILSFASQYRVMESAKTGSIELNLN